MQTTVGQLLLNESLPEDMRDYTRILDKKGVEALMSELAVKHPEKYRDISFKLQQLAVKVIRATGGNSFDITDIAKSDSARTLRKELGVKIDKIVDDDRITSDERKKQITGLLRSVQKQDQKAIFDESLAQNNPLAIQILGAGRGNPGTLASLRGSDLLYANANGDDVPVPILRSFSEGLSPAEYWAATYGARQSVIGTKIATADAGYFGKLLNQIAHRLVVVDTDEDEEPQTLRGLPSTSDDMENVGTLLAAPAGKYPRNTVITAKILHDLQRRGVQDILVRSPMAGASRDGGVYARDAGYRDFGRLPQRGEAIGNSAAQSIAEPISQGSLNSKHCLARGTLVRMADGTVKPIERIRKGDWVLGVNLQRTTFPVRVRRTFNNGRRECVRTIFRAAYRREDFILESTADHKLLAGRSVTGQKEEALNHVPRMLPVGTTSRVFYAYLPQGTENRQEWVSEPMAKLVGLLAGDGCYTEAVSSVHLSCHDPSLVDSIAGSMVPLNLKLTKLTGHEGYYAVSQIEQEQATVNDLGQFVAGARNPIKRWLEDRCMYGKYAHEKEVPEEIDTWTNESVADYLAGLFSADGSWCHPTDTPDGCIWVSLGLTSRSLLESVKRLLADRFGIYVGQIRTHVGDRKRPLHSFCITQGGEVRRITQLLIERLVGKKQIEAISAVTYTAQRFDEFRLLRRSVESIGTPRTYDIEVDHPDHLFVLANGLIVSNSGGVAGGKNAVSGFEAISQLAMVPSTFKGGAVHSELDGMVSKIEPAPAGGYFVHVEGKEHYVPDGVPLLHKKGDMVEAGDVLSEGIPNPAKLASLKSIGEAREAFVRIFKRTLKDSNLKDDRRNIELIARGLINHVRLTDFHDGHSPNDVVTYSEFEENYDPREDAQEARVDEAKNMYLEKPYLHYTIGTKIRPSVAAQLKKFGVGKVWAHKAPPPFEPEMVPADDNLGYDPDPFTRMLGAGLKKGLLDSTHRGLTSSTESTSYVPARIQAHGFGSEGLFKSTPRLPPTPPGAG